MRAYVTLTLSPETVRALADVARRAGVGRGRVVDVAVSHVVPCPERRAEHTGCPTCHGSAIVARGVAP